MRKMWKTMAAVMVVSALSAGSAFAAEKLAVKGTDGTTTKFAVDENGTITSTSPTFYFDPVGVKIGIGTTTPAAGLNVVGTGVAVKAQRDNSDTANVLTGLNAANDDQTAGNGISFTLASKDSNGTAYAGAIMGAIFESHRPAAASDAYVLDVHGQVSRTDEVIMS